MILAPGPRAVRQSFHAPLLEAPANTRHLAYRETQPIRDISACHALGRQQHDPRASHVTELRTRVRDQSFELSSLS
jgi:hypothetical protein